MPTEQIHGRDAILQRQGELEELARRCGQAGAASHLSFLLTDPLFGGKVPHLLLFRSDSGTELRAAVLVYEYTFSGFRSGIYISPDAEGERSVIAPAGQREEFAWAAATALLKHGGARLLFLSLLGTDFGPRLARETSPATRASMQHAFQRCLLLKHTVDDTLAQFGARTRRNLRAARRQATQRAELEFVSEVAMPESEYLAMSNASAYAVSEDVARWRYAAARQNGLFAGLRSRAGEWFALVGGRREAGVTTVDWQINPKQLPQMSLSLTMRSFLIEWEIAAGTSMLCFEGGTSHPMRSGFVEQTAGYALLGSGIMRPSVVRNLVRRVLPAQSLFNTWLDWDQLTWYR